MATRLQALSGLPCYALGILFRVRWAISPYRTEAKGAGFVHYPRQGRLKRRDISALWNHLAASLGQNKKASMRRLIIRLGRRANWQLYRLSSRPYHSCWFLLPGHSTSDPIQNLETVVAVFVHNHHSIPGWACQGGRVNFFSRPNDPVIAWVMPIARSLFEQNCRGTLWIRKHHTIFFSLMILMVWDSFQHLWKILGMEFSRSY